MQYLYYLYFVWQNSSEYSAHVRSELCDSICLCIVHHDCSLKRNQIIRKCATCSKLPSNTSTITGPVKWYGGECEHAGHAAEDPVEDVELAKDVGQNVARWRGHQLLGQRRPRTPYRDQQVCHRQVHQVEVDCSPRENNKINSTYNEIIWFAAIIDCNNIKRTIILSITFSVDRDSCLCENKYQTCPWFHPQPD